MSLSFTLAKFDLREDFEKFLKSLPLSYIKKLYLQKALTWQRDCMEKEMMKRQCENENLNVNLQAEVGSISESDHFSKLIATQTWY